MEKCEECGKRLSPMQANDSYNATYTIGDEGKYLCRKHMDAHRRNEWNEESKRL